MRTRTQLWIGLAVLAGLALVLSRWSGGAGAALEKGTKVSSISPGSSAPSVPSSPQAAESAQPSELKKSTDDELEEATRDYSQRCAEAPSIRRELEETDASIEALSADIQAGARDDATYDRFNEFAKQRAKLMLTLVKCQVARFQVGGSAGETETNRKGEENERL